MVNAKISYHSKINSWLCEESNGTCFFFSWFKQAATVWKLHQQFTRLFFRWDVGRRLGYFKIKEKIETARREWKQLNPKKGKTKRLDLLWVSCFLYVCLSSSHSTQRLFRIVLSSRWKEGQYYVTERLSKEDDDDDDDGGCCLYCFYLCHRCCHPIPSTIRCYCYCSCSCHLYYYCYRCCIRHRHRYVVVVTVAAVLLLLSLSLSPSFLFFLFSCRPFIILMSLFFTMIYFQLGREEIVFVRRIVCVLNLVGHLSKRIHTYLVAPSVE